MRKLLYILPGLLFLASWSVAETIESVTFNPARLGRYENLKVSDTLTTQGGINAQAVTVQSGGTVSVENSGNYQADTVDVAGQISMPSTRFVTPTMETKGTAAFVNKSSNAASEIENLNSIVRVKGNVLKLGSVTVSGTTTTDYDDNSASGLTLGGNKIPVPTSSCSNLSWISRVADDGNAYKVLGFASCTGDDGTCETSYGEETVTGQVTLIDKCDGDSENPFDCADAPRGTVTTCVDSYRKAGTSSGGTTSSGNTSMGTATAAVYTTQDTCDGDNINQYTGTPSGSSCLDVWATGSGSSLSSSFIGNIGPDNVCQTDCVLRASASPTTTESPLSTAQRLGINSFCVTYFQDSCSGCLSDQMGDRIGDEIGLGGALDNIRYYPYSCKIQYYKRTIYKNSSLEKVGVWRTVTCCGNETASTGGSITVGGTVTGGQVAVGGGTIIGGNTAIVGGSIGKVNSGTIVNAN